MCGIVGYIGSKEASEVVLDGLRRLEYRGYDSAGLATVNGGGLAVERCVGKVKNLEDRLAQSPLHGTIGMGHTRWATHGRPSEANAHPHCAGSVAVIHNGIVENYLELRAELQKRGRTFQSETDTEVIAHLIDEELTGGHSLRQATCNAAKRLQGSFAIVVLSADEADKLVAAKTATPIVVGVGQDEAVVASDIPAVLGITRDVLVLEDGDVAEITRQGVVLTDFDGNERPAKARRIGWDAVTAQTGGYAHFLAKEIHEQPQTIGDCFRGRVRLEKGLVDLGELDELGERLDRVERVSLVGCGTAWHAGLIGGFYLSELAGLRSSVDYGSEFRYRTVPIDDRDLFVAVSQSGETADTLVSLEEAGRRGAATLAVTNVVDSSIARHADAPVYMHAGPEISVCSTKAFTAQVVSLLLLGIWLGQRRRTITAESARPILEELTRIPAKVQQALVQEAAIRKLARKYANARDCLFLGRGINHPVALEGALKLKEISYVHAEGYPSGEMKHGPIALITSKMPVVVLAPNDALRPKTMGNAKEVESRGGKIIAVGDDLPDELVHCAEDVIPLPGTHPLLMPLLLTIPLQLFAYHVAVERGTDVDQPRNLAKSVTVE
jgi:glucosamine--fructose-6-phosphate aminotransferase (isomerizing)